MRLLGVIGRFLAVRKRLWLPPILVVFALLVAIVVINDGGGGLAFIYSDF